MRLTSLLFLCFLMMGCAAAQMEKQAEQVGGVVGFPQKMTQKTTKGYVDQTMGTDQNPYGR